MNKKLYPYLILLYSSSQSASAGIVFQDVTNAAIDNMFLSASALGNSILTQQNGYNPSLTVGNYQYQYTSIGFIPDATGSYAFGQTSNTYDTVMMLYSGSFDRSNPGNNYLNGNDDTSDTAHLSYLSANGFDVSNLNILCGGSSSFCPQITQNVQAGQPYTLVVSTFSPNTNLAGSNITYYSNFGQFIPGTSSTVIGANAQTEAIVENTTINLQLNRSTTLVGNTLNSMRMLRANPTKRKGGGAAGDYQFIGPFGVYVNAGGTFGNVETRSGAAGYDIYTRNFNGAVDYRFNDQLVSGFLFGYTSSSSELVNSLGRFNADTFRFSPFVSYSPTENTYIDFSAGYSSHDNRSLRNCVFCTTSATAKFRTDEFNVLTGLGYTYNTGAWSVRGYGQASAIYLDISGYQERGDIRTGLLNVSGQHVTSVTSTFGTELSYAWSLPFGVLTPRIMGEWVREYANDARITRALIQGGGSTNIATGSPETDWGNLGAGAQLTLPNGLTANFNYQSLLMSGAVNHMIEGGLRFEF